ncbi:hypothetical protein EKO04_010402 [Ascochyta lentis]|uniref:Peptidase S33 tripeptidyl aminopeptidase-like C-terminal domain-containing protein n=1 Tax=Ascochyta lentis TaxID=205686 RepID=A0A8H7MFQ7_9PLEO|nr:hypothetical protein EKO04_010402 [Ascochyta lentis]
MKHLAENATAATQDVLFNPGGPGGSGIESALVKRNQLRKVFGSSHNIVAFDPRGVGHSGPNTDCFNGDTAAAFQFASAAYPASLNVTFVSSGTWGELCRKNLDASAHYLGTPAVARDMLTFTERQAATRGLDPMEVKVNLYGVSYGTVLGATFATLYPERVGKFVLDSVMQGKPWYLNGRRDTLVYQDEAVRQFFNQCSKAGPEICTFWAGSAEETEARYEQLLESLEDDPLQIPYTAVAVDAPIRITADVVRALVFETSYHGHTKFLQLAEQLTELERGEYKSWLDTKAIPAPSCTNCTTTDWETIFETFPGSQLSKTFSLNAHSEILCTDLVPQNIPTLEAFAEIMDASWNSSRHFGLQSTDLANCRNWPFRPPSSQQFDGNFGANISHPMLILTNNFDPVCPAVYARQMSSQFPGSVLLEQEAVAHGAAFLGSNCTEGYVRGYFETGKMPPAGTVCMPDEQPVLLRDLITEKHSSRP